jgi:hypothetical protein
MEMVVENVETGIVVVLLLLLLLWVVVVVCVVSVIEVVDRHRSVRLLNFFVWQATAGSLMRVNHLNQQSCSPSLFHDVRLSWHLDHVHDDNHHGHRHNCRRRRGRHRR